MKKLNLKTLLGIAFMAFGAASCGYVEDIEGPSQSELIVTQLKQAYNMNFESRYGKVAPNQSWDFSNAEPTLSTRAIETIKTEVVDGLDFNPNLTINNNGKIDNTVQANKTLYNKIQEESVLKDGVERSGKTATLQAPQNGFYIFPVSAQGAYTHDLYIKVGDQDEIKIYGKDWTDYSHPYTNGMGTSIKNNGTTRNPEYVLDKTAVMEGIYVEAPLATSIQVYIKNIKNGNKTVTSNSLGTGTGNAILVETRLSKGDITFPNDLTKPIPDDAVIKCIGIEDNEGKYNPDGTIKEGFGDKDFNDIVLLVVGLPYVPEIIEIKDGEYPEVTQIGKRYYAEDLGNIDDFDFNDVVIDVYQQTTKIHKTETYKGEVIKDEVDESRTTITENVVIRHLGGTLPWKLYVGKQEGTETKWEDVTGNRYGVMDYNPNESLTLPSGWTAKDIYDNNLLKIEVQGTDSNGNVYTTEITQGETGKVPYMFAGKLPQTLTLKSWNDEREGVTDWEKFKQ